MQTDTGKLYRGTKEELEKVPHLEEISESEGKQLEAMPPENRVRWLCFERWHRSLNVGTTVRTAFYAGFEIGLGLILERINESKEEKKENV